VGKSQTTWRGDFPGDLRVVFHRLKKRSIGCFVVGPAVRDALSSGNMDKVARIELVAVCQSLQDVEAALEGASTTSFFFSRADRVRRMVQFNVQNASSGELLRRLSITDVPSEHDLADHLSKREVTVNALAMGEGGEVVDPFSGFADLAAQRIRPIVHPATAFLQKPLTLVKVAKHVAYHGFPADDETLENACRYASNVLDVSGERLRPELERLLVNIYPDMGLTFLEQTGILRFILPEVQSMVGFADSCEVHHKDIWDHTRKVVLKSKPHAAIRWAALLHDIGKVWTRSVDGQGRVHFFRHEDMGALLFKGIAARLALDDRLCERVEFLVRNHSRINMYTAEWTDSAVRRLMRDTGDNLEDLLALSKADITSRQERRVEELSQLLDDLGRRIEEIRAEEAREPALPRGAGDAIMQHFGLEPGPLVGMLREELEKAIEAGTLPPGLPIESYMGHLESYVRKQGKV
jgi:poly(A) polymerase